MTDPNLYIDGQLDVYDVIALIDQAAEAAVAEEVSDEYARVGAEYEAWLAHGGDEGDDLDFTEDEIEYMATQAGRILSDEDEILDHDDTFDFDFFQED